MPIDPQNTLLTVQAGLAQLSTLIVSYSFSAIGAVILLIVGYIVAGLAERSIFAGLGHIHGFDATLRHFFSKIVRYAILILVVDHGARPVRRADGVDHRRHRRHRSRHRPGAAGHAAEHRRRHHAPGAAAIPHRRICRGRRDCRHRSRRSACSPPRSGPSTASTSWRPIRRCGTSRCATSPATACAAATSRSRIGSWNDIDLAQKTLLGLAAAERRVKRDPAPIAFVATLGDSTVSITLRYWTSAADFFATQIDLTKRAKQAFDAEGISIPLPPPEAPDRKPAGNQSVSALSPIAASSGREGQFHRQRRLRRHRRETAGLRGRNGRVVDHAPKHEQAEDGGDERSPHR